MIQKNEKCGKCEYKPPCHACVPIDAIQWMLDSKIRHDDLKELHKGRSEQEINRSSKNHYK